MSITPNDITDILYKRLSGKASTGKNAAGSYVNINSETQLSIPYVPASNVYVQPIPQTVPTSLISTSLVKLSNDDEATTRSTNIAFPYIVKYTNIKLTSIPSNEGFSFTRTSVTTNEASPNTYNDILTRAILPLAAIGDIYTIQVQYKPLNGNLQTVNAANYFFDRDAGVITFYDGINRSTTPVYATFWRYEGDLLDATGASGKFNDAVAIANNSAKDVSSGYLVKYTDNGAAKYGGIIKPANDSDFYIINNQTDPNNITGNLTFANLTVNNLVANQITTTNTNSKYNRFITNPNQVVNRTYTLPSDTVLPLTSSILMNNNSILSWDTSTSSRISSLESTVNNGNFNITSLNIGNNMVTIDSNIINALVPVNTIDYNNEGKYIAASMNNTSSKGIFVSSNYGASFTEYGTSINNYTNIAISDNGKYQIAVSISANALYISSDYGTTWTAQGIYEKVTSPQLAYITISKPYSGCCINSNGSIMAAITNTTDFIYISYNYGKSWITCGSSKIWKAISISASGQYITAISDQPYYSNDYGKTWTPGIISNNTYFTWSPLLVMSANGKYQLSVRLFGSYRLVLSNDYGVNWNDILTESGFYASSYEYTSIAISSSGKYMSTCVTATNNNFVYNNNNYGGSPWITDNSINGFSIITSLAISATGKHWYAASANNGLAYNSNYGNKNSWTILPSTNYPWNKIAISRGLGTIIENNNIDNNLLVNNSIKTTQLATDAASANNVVIGNPIFGSATYNLSTPLIAAQDGTAAQLRLTGVQNVNQQLLLGYNTLNDYGRIQSVLQGTGYKMLTLNPGGGSVVVNGTDDNGYNFYVNGSAGVTSLNSSGVINTSNNLTVAGSTTLSGSLSAGAATVDSLTIRNSGSLSAGAATVDNLTIRNSGVLSAGAATVTSLSSSGSISTGSLTVNNTNIALGTNAGSNNQTIKAVAIGLNAGQFSQSEAAVAIGDGAGTYNQGKNSIMIGQLAGYSSSAANSICLNATSAAINPANSGFYVKPIRNDSTKTSLLAYDTSTNEIVSTPTVNLQTTVTTAQVNQTAEAQYVIIGTRYNTPAGANGNIYVSSNYGQTLTQITTLKDGSTLSNNIVYQYAAVSATGQYQIIVTAGGYIYCSSEYGINGTWRVITVFSNCNWSYADMSANGRYQYATSSTSGVGICMSSDYGYTWQSVTTFSDVVTTYINNINYNWLGISVSASGQYVTVANNNGYILTSQDYGITWYMRDNTPRPYTAIRMSATGRYQLASTFDSSTNTAQCFRSTNYGISWQLISAIPNTGTYNHNFCISANGKYQLLISYGLLYLSSDYGVIWTQISGTGLPGGMVAGFMSASGQNQYLLNGNNGGIYVSNDFGTSWTNKYTAISSNVSSLIAMGGSSGLGNVLDYENSVLSTATITSGVIQDLEIKNRIHNFSGSMNISNEDDEGRYQLGYIFQGTYNKYIVYSYDYGYTWNRINLAIASDDNIKEGIIRRTKYSNNNDFYLTVIYVVTSKKVIKTEISIYDNPSITITDITKIVLFQVNSSTTPIFIVPTPTITYTFTSIAASHAYKCITIAANNNTGSYIIRSVYGQSDTWKSKLIDSTTGSAIIRMSTDGKLQYYLLPVVNKLYYSNNYGESWSWIPVVSNSLTFNISADGRCVTILTSSAVYYSNNYGASLRAVNIKSGLSRFNTLTLKDSISISCDGKYQIMSGVTSLTDYNCYTYRSTDYGITWYFTDTTGSNCNGGCDTAFLTASGKHQFITNGNTLSKSSDYGQSWSRYTGTGDSSIKILDITSGYVSMLYSEPINGNSLMISNVRCETLDCNIARGLNSVKAFISFNGSTLTILNAYNFSFIYRRNSTAGKYTLNFLNPMPDNNYLVVGSVKKSDTNDDLNMIFTLGASNTTYSTEAFDITVGFPSNFSTVDSVLINLIVI